MARTQRPKGEVVALVPLTGAVKVGSHLPNGEGVVTEIERRGARVFSLRVEVRTGGVPTCRTDVVELAGDWRVEHRSEEQS